MEKSSVDLLNVDYDDVLNLYRGWKRSEGLLQNKSKELTALKTRMKQLQESHAKFRSQIQALESVKELTVTLQSELSSFQQENVQLEAENNELARINQKAEENLDKARRDIDQLTKALHDYEVKSEHIRGRYEEVSRTNAELERTVSEEKANRLAAENRVRIAEAQIADLQADNRALLDKLNSKASREQDTDRDLRQAASQLMTLSNEVAKLGEVKEELAVVEAEKDILKGDIARLIRLLEHYPAAEGFVQRWYDNQGLSFSGLDRLHGSKGTGGHRDDPEARAMGLASDLITPEEFAHLKRLHGGGDPFPMTASMQEESENWVPEETARLGVRFLDARLGSATAVAAASSGGPGGVTAYRRQVIRDFVRNANQIWMKREARKIKRIQMKYSEYISDLKRQLANLRPYHGVMAERKIRRLESQVKEERNKRLTGRPKKWSPDDESDCEMDGTDLAASSEAWDDASRSRSASAGASSRGRKSLDASKTSTRISATRSHSASGARYGSPGRSTSHPEENLEAALLSMESAVGLEQPKLIPSADYLRGAMWLGRNIVMEMDTLVNHIEGFRSQYLKEVNVTAKDKDLERACHRMALLAASRVNDVVAFAAEEKDKIQKMLHTASTLQPGDIDGFEQFLHTLPIESILLAKVPHHPAGAQQQQTHTQTGTGAGTSGSGGATVGDAPRVSSSSRHSK